MKKSFLYTHPKYGPTRLMAGSEAYQLWEEGKLKEMERCVTDAWERANKLEGTHGQAKS